jgi:hypothetical protein
MSSPTHKITFSKPNPFACNKSLRPILSSAAAKTPSRKSPFPRILSSPLLSPLPCLNAFTPAHPAHDSEPILPPPTPAPYPAKPPPQQIPDTASGPTSNPSQTVPIPPLHPATSFPPSPRKHHAPKRISFQGSQILHESGPKRIQMDISNQFLKIRLLRAQDGLISVLKQVAMPPIPPIEIDRIPGQKPPHGGGNGHAPRLHQQMKMIGHEHLGQAADPGLLAQFSKAPQEVVSILVIPEDRSSLNPPNDNMVQAPGTSIRDFLSMAD